VQYVTRRNAVYHFAAADIWPTADVDDELRTHVKCNSPGVFVNGDSGDQTGSCVVSE